MIADLAARVTWTGGVTVAVMTAGAWWLAGAPAAAGVGGVGSIARLNFRWLARDVSRATALIAGGQSGVGRIGRSSFTQEFRLTAPQSRWTSA